MKTETVGNSLAVQWLELCAVTAEGRGSTPAQGTEVPHTEQCGGNQPTNQPNKPTPDPSTNLAKASASRNGE